MIRQPQRLADSPTITRIRDVLSRYGAIVASPDEIVEAQAMAARRMKAAMTSAEAMAAVQARSGAAVFIVREAGAIAGVMGFVLLSAIGRASVLADRFNALEPAMADVCSRRDEPAAIYGWGIATLSHSATKTLVEAACAMGQQVTPHLRWYMRTVTADGERLIMKRQGWRRVPRSSPGLIWKPSLIEREAAAA
jgi:hypothetical protein